MKQFLLAVMLVAPVATAWADVEPYFYANYEVYIPCFGAKYDFSLSGIQSNTPNGYSINANGENYNGTAVASLQETYQSNGATEHFTTSILVTSDSVFYKSTKVFQYANGTLIRDNKEEICQPR